MKLFAPAILLTASLLTCHLLFAQKKTFSGYYLTPRHDTVKGLFPNYAQWSKNPSQVAFVAAGTMQSSQLTPQNTHTFVVEGYDEYLSYTGPRLMNAIEDFDLLNNGSFAGTDDSIQQTETFLRLVTRTPGGDLYVLNDEKRPNFFYRLPGGPLLELRYKKAVLQNRISEMADYRQQLNNLFAEAVAQKNLSSTLADLPYAEGELSSFLQDLFPTASQHRRKQGGGTEWVVSAGAVHNMVSVQADPSVDSGPHTYSSSVSPLLAAGFIVPLSRNFGKYFIYPQLKLFRYKNRGEESKSTSITAVTYQADLVAVAQLSAGINIINGESFRFFVTGGFGLLGQLGGKKVKQLYASSDRKPYGNATEVKLSAMTYAIDGSAGVELNRKIQLLATYLVPSNIANFVFYKPQLSGVQVRVGYKL